VRDGTTEPTAGDAAAPATPPLPAVPPGRATPADLLPAPEIAATRRFLDQARADSTRHKYARDWAAFAAWCRERGLDSLPAHPEALAVYLAAGAERGLAPPTLTRKLAAIGYAHRRAGLEPPHRAHGGAVALDTLAGIRRAHGRPPTKKTAAEADLLFAVLLRIDGDTLAALRDRAILAFGMASALRRGELVALDVADLAWAPRGLRVAVRRSKTDQTGQGATIAVPNGRRLKPVEALRRWLAAASIAEGAVFRPLATNGRRALPARLSDRAIARIVQARFAAAGHDPARFAAHSLRSGFLTSAAHAGASLWKMREVSRHRSVQVLSDYVQHAELLDDHAGSAFL
jgi:site-specific recombinase XerD